MTLRAFQQALCELIASPDACLSVREDPSHFIARFNLSEREANRLREVVWQRGMSTNCTLYRSNRITSIYTLLHYTCVLLGGDLQREVDAYWASCELVDLQYRQEIPRFARFLKGRIAAGIVANEFVEDVLDFELATADLRFSPRRRILEALEKSPRDAMCGPFRLNPLIRVVRFRHEPSQLLALLAQRRLPSSELERGEYFLVLNAMEEPLAALQIEVELGRILSRIQSEGVCREHSNEILGLVQANLLVPLTHVAPSTIEETP